MTQLPATNHVMASTGTPEEDTYVFATPFELLSHLRSHDIRLWLDNGRLRYSAPDGAMTPALRATIAEHKTAIIHFLSQAKTAVQATPPPILPLPRDVALPLSFAQQRLWLLDQLIPGNSLYNIFQAVRLQGPLHLAALAQTLSEIARRHEVLRTTFAMVNGRPTQIITPPLALAPPLVDLSELHENEREAEVQRLATEAADRPFDLALGPLWRVTVLRLGRIEHVVLFTMHHIVSDGWSMGVLVQEVATLYEAFSSGRPSPLADLPLQYADFAYWQRQWLQGAVLESQLSYWKQQLAGAPTGLPLPTDQPRPAVQTFRGAHFPFTLSPALSQSLKSLSQQEGATLFMTLLAAFNALLYRGTGQEDILVGTPIANRNRAEIEQLIGFFINILVLRTNLSGNPSFRELLERVREVTLGAYAHQDLPFEKLVDELRPGRDLSRAPFAQVAFALQNAPLSKLELSELSLNPLRVTSNTAKTDLVLFMTEGPAGLNGIVEYNIDLFDVSTIAHMVELFQKLLEAIVDDPARPIWQLPPSPGELLFPVKEIKTPIDEFEAFSRRSNLTKHQLLIWLDQKLQPDVRLYNFAATCTIPARIVVHNLQKAFQTLVNSSDALRTVIVEVEGVPQQRIIENYPYEVTFLDFSQLPDPDAAIEVWVRQRAELPFDLNKRLFDAALIKLADERFVAYINQHHIISDGWSAALILRYMADLYERSLKGQLPDVVELPSYQDYIHYDRKYRNSARHRRAEAYWKRQLAEELEPVTFYGKTLRRQTTRIQRVVCDLGPERTKKLRTIAVRKSSSVMTENAAVFNVFAALLFTYLYRLSGNRRLSLGIPLHNRRSQSFKETVGFFMQVCPLQVVIARNETFSSLADKVAAAAFDALRYGQYTIRNPRQNPAYDVVLNYHPETFLNFHGIPVAVEWLHPGHGNESLALHVRDFDSSGSFVLDFAFHCDVFTEEERQRALRHFLQVLDTFLEDDTQPLDHVALLAPEEKHNILVELNQTETLFPERHSFARLFEAQVGKTPDRVAVAFDGQTLTYAQLNARANRWAYRLRSLGVKAEVLVAIMARRSIDFLTAILAIFKAGGAYLPLDPLWPPARLAQVLSQSKTPLVLAADEFLPALAQALESSTPDEQPATLAIARLHQVEQPAQNLHGRLVPTNLSYVIYTSGSTGVPKGAMIEQAGMINHLYAKIADLALQEVDIVAQTASQCFDISVWQFLAALLVGGQVRIVNDEVAHDPVQLLELVEHEKVTVLETVPSLLRIMLEGMAENSGNASLFLPALRWLMVTGEALPPELCRHWLHRYPDIPLLNAYGPTECSDDVTHHVIHRAPAEDVVHVPIGRPIANMRLYILDQTLSPVPLGVTGELYVGGTGVGRGYLHNSGRTAAAFIPDPFAPGPGNRLYKTGDLARYLPDGSVEFLGRADYQVKIRGFRIELGEIESALGQHPALREAVVLTQEKMPGQKRLVAYVVPSHQATPPTVGELRRFLQERLPDYMVPAAFVVLATLPLTPNGKVNRRALPEPDHSQPALASVYVAPRTPAEKALAGIWCDVLGVKAVGVLDNFFELGGDSILGIQVVARANQAGLRLTPVQLFQYPTVEGQARMAGTAAPIAANQDIVTGSVPLTPIQHLFFEYLPADPHHWNWSFLREVAPGLSTPHLSQTIQHLLVHHDALRLRFRQTATGWQQISASPDEPTPFNLIDLSMLAPEDQSEAVESAAAALQTSLSLSQGPLLRLVYFDLGPQQPDRVLIIFHHLVVDVVSARILMEDFQRVYQQLVQGQPVQLPAKTTSFQQWSRRLSEYAQSAGLRQEMDYWITALKQQDIPALPLDYPQGINSEDSTGTIVLSLEAEATRALLQELPARRDTQINEILLTALVRVFSRWTGKQALLVDLEGHGREAILDNVDLSRTVGWFTSIFSVLLRLSETMGLDEAMAATKEQLHRIPGRGIGYGLLRYLSGDNSIKRQMRDLPRAQVNFNYLGQFNQKLSTSMPFRPAREYKGPERSLSGMRGYPLYIVSSIGSGRLHTHWNYSKNLHRPATVENLARSFNEELHVLIEHVLSSQAD